MSPNNRESTVLEYAMMAEGVACELRWDAPGTLELPGTDRLLIAVHVGAPAQLACWRADKRFRGTAVHGDMDIVPAHTSMRWEMYDHNDTSLMLSLPQLLLDTVAEAAALDATRMELRNQFQLHDRQLETLMWAIKQEMEVGSPSGRLYLDGLALAVASRVGTHYSSVPTPRTERAEGLDKRTLTRVVAFIEEQLADDLSLEMLATIAGISSSHLQTRFQQSMGVPVHQYVIQRRVERAKTLLLEDQVPIAEIALAAGFAHQSHMARHLRRMLGMSPRTLRRLNRER